MKSPCNAYATKVSPVTCGYDFKPAHAKKCMHDGTFIKWQTGSVPKTGSEYWFCTSRYQMVKSRLFHTAAAGKTCTDYASDSYSDSAEIRDAAWRSNMIKVSKLNTKKETKNQLFSQALPPLLPASCAKQGRTGLDQVGNLSQYRELLN